MHSNTANTNNALPTVTVLYSSSILSSGPTILSILFSPSYCMAAMSTLPVICPFREQSQFQNAFILLICRFQRQHTTTKLVTFCYSIFQIRSSSYFCRFYLNWCYCNVLLEQTACLDNFCTYIDVIRFLIFPRIR